MIDAPRDLHAAFAPPAGDGARTILMTADAVGGVWTYALELARALAQRDPGTRVHLAVLGPAPDAAQAADACAVPGLTLHHHDGALEWMDEPWDDVARAGEWLLALERTLMPDVVHLNGYAHGALPWRAPAVVVAHSCVCSWWRAVHGEAAPPRYDRYRAEVRAGLEAARVVVAPTVAMRDALRAEHGGGWTDVVIPNGRDARRFVPGMKEARVLTAGRVWDAAKNVGAVVRAATALPADWQVEVAGDEAPPAGAAGQSARGVGRGGAPVRFLGRLAPARVADRMAHAAIYALPARYEPFGLSALEAAFAGCALVLGDVPSLREVWGDDAAAWVPPDDVDALGRTLAALASDGARRRALAAAARERARRFTPARMAAGYAALHDAVRAEPTRAGVARRVDAAALAADAAPAR